MTKFTTTELRKTFLDFFAARGHEIVPSSSLVPANDPTLLFTNAGMVQFKDVFLGRETRAIPRAASAQRCLRAGGKHNDLENVGYTARHHTFFEMLGNFSFGDYFKREAIRYAWEFVTEVLGLPPERLWCTVFKDDDEAARIWLEEIGVDPGRFGRMGESDNFWSMGDTGPCGPCSEIFYDHGPEVPGGPPGSPDEDGDRFVEIWNLVFMQFERDEEGRLTPLPKPSVDTGMGLERLAAVMQGVHSNYETDLFKGLIHAAAKETGTADLESKSLRVIADHIRACTFLIVDGVLPGNEGRGYVLRRIIRRAVRHGYKLGVDRPFLNALVSAVEEQMGSAYPELIDRGEHVRRVLLKEEQRFAETLAQGMRLLEEAIASLPPGGVIPGETAFKLYDTYGFPEDLTADIARERNLSVDHAGFEQAMAEQRERARRSSRFAAPGEPRRAEAEAAVATLASVGGSQTVFLGYETLAAEGRVLALFREGQPVEALQAGETGTVVLDRTPFYAESGGQVGDTGVLAGRGFRFDVLDTRKLGDAHAHLGRVVAGELRRGQDVRAEVDGERRSAIVLNHSATHLLHAALRKVLGEHVQQRGSLVAPDRLRFDFSHYAAMTAEEIRHVETLVNEQIRLNYEADIQVVPYQQAMAGGALAFFGEKYGEEVRVLRLGDFSMELCGGTHVRRSGDIGFFKIVAESGIAAGVRRVEAVTGQGALQWAHDAEQALKQIAGLLKGGRDEAVEKVEQLIERNRTLERELQELKRRFASGEARDLLKEAVDVEGVRVLAARLDGADARALREAADRYKDKLGSGVVVLGAVEAGKVRLVAGVTRDLTSRLPAGRLVGRVAERVGGRGGGREDFAQAGGSEPEKLDEALAQVPEHVAAMLKQN